MVGARRPTVSNNSKSKNSSSSKIIIIIIIIIIKSTDKHYEHIRESVTAVNDTTIMWAVPISTDRTILANRPDIVPHDKKEKTCVIIDIATPDD